MFEAMDNAQISPHILLDKQLLLSSRQIHGTTRIVRLSEEKPMRKILSLLAVMAILASAAPVSAADFELTIELVPMESADGKEVVVQIGGPLPGASESTEAAQLSARYNARHRGYIVEQGVNGRWGICGTLAHMPGTVQGSSSPQATYCLPTPGGAPISYLHFLRDDELQNVDFAVTSKAAPLSMEIHTIDGSHLSAQHIADALRGHKHEIERHIYRELGQQEV
jgi:hypothetical protein